MTESSGEESSSRESSRSRSPIKEDRRMERLRRENADLRNQISELLEQNKRQQEQIAKLEEAAQSRHGETVNHLKAIEKALANKTREEEPMEVTTAPSGSKRAARESADEDNLASESSAAKKKATEKSPSIDKTTQATTEGEKTSPPAPKAPRIPPIVLRKQERWGAVSARLKEAKINFTKAKLIGGNIQVEPTTIDDHRRMTRYLAEAKEEYHTYSLPETRYLRVVIRGIPDGVPTEEVKEDLQSQGFQVQEVLRMTSRRTKRSMPLVLAKLPTTQDGVLKVTRCCSLVVRVELQREAARAAQCFRCQRFGHAQSNCQAEYRCVKCGENHTSRDCKKRQEEPAKCANCGGAHPASYRGCPRQPKRTPKAAPASQATQQAQKTRPAPAKRTTPTTSFADAARGRKAPQAAPVQKSGAALTAASLTAALAQMQQMCSAMSAFFAQMPATFKA